MFGIQNGAPKPVMDELTAEPQITRQSLQGLAEQGILHSSAHYVRHQCPFISGEMKVAGQRKRFLTNLDSVYGYFYRVATVRQICIVNAFYRDYFRLICDFLASGQTEPKVEIFASSELWIKTT